MVDGVNNILLTGLPGIGKTTIIQKVIRELALPAGGFYTQEIREGNVRAGFRIVSLNGAEGLLAHRTLPGPFRVGRYGVNVPDIEGIGVKALREALSKGTCIIIDEIGKMELFSEAFRRCVLECLDAPMPVLGTIQMKTMPFLNRIRSREDVTIINVSLKNRDHLPLQLIGLLQGRGGDPKVTPDEGR